MLFNTWAYAAFLPVVVVLHWIIPKRFRNGLLLIASYVFYGSWDVRFLLLLFLSTMVDFAVGRSLGTTGDPRLRRGLLFLSLAVNLGILGTFKYLDFFLSSAAGLLTELGVSSNVSSLGIILPVGISFYTFQTMSYTIDVYRRRQVPEANFVRFALYVSFFPQLVAGPIERARRLLPQLESRSFSSVGFEQGVMLIARGLFKKVVIADSMARLVDTAYGAPEGIGTVGALLAIYAFAIQIYGDFSGYTDIARGSAKLLGVDLMENFAQPYFSRSITEFWRRWHISLSEWLRDYLYIPLGGNRKGPWRTMINLLLTMLLGGLWHGAAWTFVIWGGLHGLWLALERSRGFGAQYVEKLTGSDWWRVALTFHGVALLWIVFRAESLAKASEVLSQLASFENLGRLDLGGIAVVALMMFFVVRMDRIERQANAKVPPSVVSQGLVLGGLVVGIVIFAGVVGSPFIYFQF